MDEVKESMDYRVRIMLLSFILTCSVHGLSSVEEEIPPSLQRKPKLVSKSVLLPSNWYHTTSKESTVRPSTNMRTSGSPLLNGGPSMVQLSTASSRNVVSSSVSKEVLTSVTANATGSNVAAPEFEDRNEQDEGGKGEEEPDAHVDEGANAAPPADDVAAGEGIAKEDTEPLKGKDKEENQLGAMVEDAKGNAPAPPTSNKFQTHIDFDQSEDSHFMTFIVVGGLLVFCLYLLHHNKKKILGLIFEGRSAGHSRRNVRYRRLSQRDNRDSLKEDVIY